MNFVQTLAELFLGHWSFDRLEHFRAKWTPVRVKKMRLNKDLERFRDSVKFGNALAKAT